MEDKLFQNKHEIASEALFENWVDARVLMRQVLKKLAATPGLVESLRIATEEQGYAWKPSDDPDTICPDPVADATFRELGLYVDEILFWEKEIQSTRKRIWAQVETLQESYVSVMEQYKEGVR
jgi:hypothetical protein